MMDYILLAILILASILLIYLISKSIKNFGFKDRRISAFKNDVQIYLKESYPKINFDYGVFDKFKEEKENRVRQVLIAENLALQFANYPFEFSTQPPIDSKLLWSTYEADSKPVKNKRPVDLKRRKQYTFKRDHQSCIRCGLKLMQDDATLATMKPISQQGTYHFENLAILCKDCYKVLKGIDPSSISQDSKLLHDVIKKVHF